MSDAAPDSESASERGASPDSESDVESGDTVLDIEGLSVEYGEVSALRDIDLRVGEGEFISVIGPNGAGKTTLVETISGLLEYEGSVRYRGTEVATQSVSDLVSDGLIHCTEERDLFGYMSVEDNLRLGTYRRGDTTERLEFVYDLFPVLEERADQRARTMSGGEQQMLAVGRALMGDPDVLLLDEPTLGLAPVIVDDLGEAIAELHAQGLTIVLAEQNSTFAMRHAERLYLLETGDIELSGTAEEFENSDYVRDAYMGLA
jgi:branched-chain amino acid transport system ATP-binding protein